MELFHFRRSKDRGWKSIAFKEVLMFSTVCVKVYGEQCHERKDGNKEMIFDWVCDDICEMGLRCWNGTLGIMLWFLGKGDCGGGMLC